MALWPPWRSGLITQESTGFPDVHHVLVSKLFKAGLSKMSGGCSSGCLVSSVHGAAEVVQCWVIGI